MVERCHHRTPGYSLRRQYDITPQRLRPPSRFLAAESQSCYFCHWVVFLSFFFSDSSICSRCSGCKPPSSPFTPPHFSPNTFPDLPVSVIVSPFFFPSHLLLLLLQKSGDQIRCSHPRPVSSNRENGSTFKLFYWLGWIIDEDRMK